MSAIQSFEQIHASSSGAVTGANAAAAIPEALLPWASVNLLDTFPKILLTILEESQAHTTTTAAATARTSPHVSANSDHAAAYDACRRICLLDTSTD
eukprot:2444593-Pyramimonas_sp.AAC.1